MEDNKEKVGAEATTKENAGTTEVTETRKTFDELLQDKEYQSAFDKKIAQSIQTAKAKWDEEKKSEKAEAEKLAKMNADQKAQYEKEKLENELAEYKRKENARTLRDEALNIMTEKEIPTSYAGIFNFENMSAEQVKTAIETIETLRNKDRENWLNQNLKQKTPTQKQTTSVSKDEDAFLKGFNIK